MTFGDCDTCNAVILVIIFVLTGLYFKWSSSKSAASTTGSTEETTPAPEPKKSKKSKKSKAKTTEKPATKKAEPKIIEESENESEPEAQPEPVVEEAVAEPLTKSQKKRLKKKNKAAEAVASGEHKKIEKVEVVKKVEKEESKKPAAKKNDRKKEKAAAKKDLGNDDEWTSVTEKSDPTPTPQAAPTQPTKKAAPKKAAVAADDYLKSLPEEIRQQILAANSKFAQEKQQNKGNNNTDEWTMTKDDNAGRNSNSAGQEPVGNLGAGISIDDAAVKREDVKKIFIKTNIWNKIHETKEISNIKVQLAGGILDYSW